MPLNPCLNNDRQGLLGMISAGCKAVIMQWVCVAGFLTLAAMQPAQAIDLQPGEIAAPPPGMSFVQLNFMHSERGDLYAANQKVSNATKLVSNQFQLRYIHTFETADLPSVVYVQTPLGQVQPQKALRSFYTSESGVGDTTLVYAIWPYANREEKKYWGVGVYLTLPTGQYEAANGLINMGGNRYSYALQTGYQMKLLPNLNWMAAVDGVWFGKNDNYFDNQLATQQKTLKQEALYTAQTGLAYDLSKQFSLAAAYFYTEGGQRILDNVAVANSTSQMQRYQLTATARFSFATMMLQYGDDISTKNGYIEDSRVIFRVIKAF
jgi:hypothetical protein